MCLSSALWKNGGLNPYAVWHGRSDGSSMDETRTYWGLRIGQSERDNFGGKYGASHCNQWGLFTIGNNYATTSWLLAEFLELQACQASSLRPGARCG